jgi:putative iron-regulated protein
MVGFTPRIWTGLTAVLAGAALAGPAAVAGPVAIGTPMPLASGEGGEGGEGGGEGSGKAIYLLESKDTKQYAYDAKAEVDGYINLVRDSYGAAAANAKTMRGAIEAFLKAPSEATLGAARGAWVKARPSYLVTEAFRFYDGPIEAVEGRINAWPLNEAFIDYVQGDPKAGIINDPAKPVTLAAINKLDQAKDEADVTTGWHAIEFLLWGLDFSTTGPGNRPYTDYLPGKDNNDRRRAYLKIVTEQLVSDLDSLAGAWDPAGKGSYAAKLIDMAQREVIGRALNGMAILAGHEFASERMAVALDSGDQEDEHSCFSDTTNQDFIYDFRGIKAVWTGQGPVRAYPGLGALVAKRDPKLRTEIDALLANTEARIAALDAPWDQVLASPPGSPARKEAEAAIRALQALGDGLRRAGVALGVLVQIPGRGD